MAAHSGNIGNTRSSRGRWLRPAAWGCAVLLLLLPLVAMQFTTEVNWNAADFAVFGAMLLCAGGGYEMAVRLTRSKGRRALAAVALAAAFFVVWGIGAVGI